MKLTKRTVRKLSAVSLIVVFIITVLGMMFTAIDKALKELLLSILRNK